MTSTYADRSRNLRYDHPTSVKRRAEDAAKPEPNPVMDLRRKQAAEDAARGQKHTREIIALGQAPDRIGETREDRQRKLMQKLHAERRGLTEKQGGEMRRAVEMDGK